MSVEPVNGIHKDVSGAILLPMTVSTYPVDWVFLSLGHSTVVCVLMEGIIHLWLPTHTPSSTINPTPLPPTHSLLCAICDIKVTVKQVDILISKNQALQILYLKHCVYKQRKLPWITNLWNPRKCDLKWP